MMTRRCLAGLCLLASLWSVRPAQAEIPLFSLPYVDDVPTRIDIRHDVGDGLSFESGFTSFNAFLPYYQCDNFVAFTDTHVNYFDQHDIYRASFGGGARYYMPMIGKVVGVNAYYDNSSSGNFTYNQFGFGFDVFSDYFDLRGNVYIPLGSNRNTLASFSTLGGFSGFNITQSRTDVIEAAPGGGDIEVGVTLPMPERVVSRAYLGYYNYQGQGTPQINGVRGRLEASVLDFLTIDATVQNDRVNGWTAYAGLGIRFGGPSTRETGEVALCDRRADRIERSPVTPVSTTVRSLTAPAINTATGLPLTIIHVNSSALPGGDGTFAAPFRTLAEAQAAGGGKDIIYVHAGSTLFETGFTLQNNQRLLGEGGAYPIQLQGFGTILLPPATSGGSIPIIRVPLNGTGVTLAQNNEVAGFRFQGTTETIGIAATGSVGFFNLHNNSFDGFAGMTNGKAIRITDASGSGLITNSSFTNNATGIFISQAIAGRNVNIGIRDNTYLNNTMGVTADTSSGSLGLQFLRNTATPPNAMTSFVFTNTAGTFVLEDLVGDSPNPNIGPGILPTVPIGTLGLP